MSNVYGRQVVVPLTNKSGGSVAAGDVVVVDTTNNEAFTTSTAGAVTGGVGIAQETIANNATGRVLIAGYAALVNVNASVTRGNYGKTYTVVKQATDAGSSRVAGTFCQFLTGGTTPTARVFSPDLGAAAGNVAADAIWDAAGDLAVGTGADTAAKLTKGTATYALVAGASTVAWSEVLPWHISIVPMIWTPDATAGTWANSTQGANGEGSFPFFTVGSAANSGLPSVWLNTSGAQNDAFSYDIVLAAGTWDVHFYCRKAPAYGIITLKQDTVSQGTTDLYAAAGIAAKNSITGMTVSTTGKHTFQVIMATKNASATNYFCALWGIEFRRTA